MADRFKQNILAFPDQLSLNALGFTDLEKLKGVKPDAVVLCGMGGSGIPATLLQNIAEYAIMDLPVVVWKDFGLPHLSFKNPLFIFVSFSGNTAETLSGFEASAAYKLRAVVSAGGTLLDEATEKKLPRAIVPPLDMVPRQASGILVYGILGILKAVFPKLSAPDLSKTIAPEPLEAVGLAVAKKIKGNNVVLYTATNESHIGSIFKIQLTETGKTPAFCNTYPEINHIEIVGFDRKPKGLVSLFPVTEQMSEVNKQLIAIDQEVLAKRGITPITVSIPGKTPLETAMNALVLACWTGYHLAGLYKMNPENTETITEIKAILKKHGLSTQ